MKIETEPRDDHQVKVVAEFESTELDKYKLQAARKISREGKIPGFRPGKAPYNVVLRMFGEKAILDQALDLMMDAVYPQVLDEAGLKPPYPGTLDEVISLDPPKFSFIIPLTPTVDLGGYRDIRKEYLPTEVTETEVDEYLERLQTSYSTAEPVDRPAQQGDLVAFKITGTFTEPAEDQEADLFKDSNHQLVIGESSRIPDVWPYEGFSKELTGLSANDEKEIPYTYPQEHESEKLRGKSIVYHVTVESVKEMHKPEINDEFAQMLGQFESLQQLREALRESILANKTRQYDANYFDELIDEIVEGATVAYPPQMLEEEEHQVVHNYEHSLADQGMELATYLKMMNMDMEAFTEKEVRPAAQRRLARGLVVDELTRKEELRLEKSELEAALSELIGELQSRQDLADLQKRMSQKEFTDGLAYEAAGRAMNRRMLRRLKSIATGLPEEEPVTAEEADEAETAETAAEQLPEPGAVVETQEAEESTGAEPTSTAAKPAADAPEA